MPRNKIRAGSYSYKVRSNAYVDVRLCIIFTVRTKLRDSNFYLVDFVFFIKKNCVYVSYISLF